MSAEKERLNLDIIALLLAYHAKNSSIRPSITDIIREANVIKTWVNTAYVEDSIKPDVSPKSDKHETKPYSREHLISICERSIVALANWNDRNTPNTQVKIGQCRALLKAGCSFEVHIKPRNFSDTAITDDKTIWLTIRWPSFADIESGDWEDEKQCSNSELFYLPTEKRLEEANGNDWY